MATTKAPTGLTIARSGNAFTIKWKLGQKGYTSQQFQYAFSGMKWTSLSTAKTATSKGITFPAGNYYPSKGKICYTLQIRIRAKKGKAKWSGWQKKVYTFVVPLNPSISATVSEEVSNQTTFSWSVTNAGTDARHFVNIEWQTVLVKDCNYTDGAKAPWNSKQLGWATGATGASGSLTRVEDTTLLAQASYTRWVRVRARGARGASDWRYARHVYARPYQAKIKNATANTTDAGGFQVTAVWEAAAPASNPIDATTVQYAIVTPLSGMKCPSGASWQDADVSKDTSGTDGSTFSIDNTLSVDECLFVRVNTAHDKNITRGEATLAAVGYLADPTNLSVQINDANHKATVTATNASTVEDSFLAVYYRGASNPEDTFVVGIIPHGQTSVTVQGPDWTGESAVAFGVQAVVGTYTPKPRADGATSYELTTTMTSENTYWEGGSVPSAPDNVTVAYTDISGMVRVAWDWTWDAATAAEISWSTNPYAWESTTEPQTYTVSNLYASAWNIVGLETGTKWYIRVRLIASTGEGQTYGPYSDTATIDLASAPSIPVLTLSTGVITEDGSVTASWGYSSTDGTSQGYAELREYSFEYEKTSDTAIISGKTYYLLNEETATFVAVASPVAPDLSLYYERVDQYGDIIAHAETAQHVTINAKDAGWESGNQYGLVLRVISRSGRESDGWSDPAWITVAEPLTAEITQSSLVTSGEDTLLTALPFTITVTGAGTGGTTIVAIERAASYYLDRPDETTFNGHEGETVALMRQTGEAQMTIALDDLIGPLDDGAPYRIVATVQDGLGQSAEARQDFTVAWEHQALMPEATVEIDTSFSVAKITPTAPTGTEEGDTFDIYRLSADLPELIVEDGAWGTTYVDPYPAIGEYGGHRVVFKTINGDYITEDNTMAWIDLGEEEGDRLDSIDALIDFNGYQLPIRYNVTLSNGWDKDFRETRYLGGAIQGDWNVGVSRSGSVKASAISAVDAENISVLRRLAAWTGICHVRTLDGSSYAADVQVSDDISWEQGPKAREVSLSITRVDPEGPEGLTLQQWEQGQDDTEEEPEEQEE